MVDISGRDLPDTWNMNQVQSESREQ